MECDGCSFGLLTFNSVLEDEEMLVAWLRAHNVLLKDLQCSTCGIMCSYTQSLLSFNCYKRSNIKGKRSHHTSQSIRRNTWFANSRLTMAQVCRLCVLWGCIRPPRDCFIGEELKVSRNTVLEWSSFCRDVCTSWCERHREKIGGPGVVVEIDETKFGKKRTYKRGCDLDALCVVGGYERTTNKIFVVVVPNHTQNTLLAVIKAWILPGTTVISDCWKAYNCLDSGGYKRLAVSHSLSFVDAANGEDTQLVKRIWREIRAIVPRYTRNSEHCYSYVCEFLWKRSLPHHCDRIHSFFKDLVAVDFNPLEVVDADEAADGETDADEQDDAEEEFEEEEDVVMDDDDV